MKSILLSIKPQYVAKILNGEKTIEIRKHAIPVGTKAYIYVCKNKLKLFFKKLIKKFVCALKHEEYEEELNGKVVASFVVDRCEDIKIFYNVDDDYLRAEVDTLTLVKKSQLKLDEIIDYANGKKKIFALHISQLKIFDRPKELKEFAHYPNCKKCTGDGNDSCCYCDWRYQITKAPQSYCYVEELENEF